MLPDGTALVGGGKDGVRTEELTRSLGLRPPFRAEAVRRSGSTWAVGATAITVVELPGWSADELEVVWDGTERAVRVDGEPSLASVPELERLAAGRFDTWVARARRLDGDYWEIEVEPL